MIEKIKDHCIYDDEVIEAYINLGITASKDPEDIANEIDEAYNGSYKDDEDFAQDMADQLGAMNSSDQWPYTCIDWTYAAQELMYDYSEDGGHYFRNL